MAAVRCIIVPFAFIVIALSSPAAAQNKAACDEFTPCDDSGLHPQLSAR